MRGPRAIVLLGTIALAVATARAARPGPAPDETQVYTGGEETAPGRAGRVPAVEYWRVRTSLALDATSQPVRLGLLVPLSDGRQEVLARRVDAAGLRFDEDAAPPNLRLVFSGAVGEARTVAVDVTVRITEASVALPPRPVRGLPLPDGADALGATDAIPAADPDVVAAARDVVGPETRLDAVVWSLYQHVAAWPPLDGPPGPQDARTVLRTRQGTSLGRARALVALLRAAGVPARLVGGLRLEHATRRRATSSWVEAWTGDAWAPLDPTQGAFATLPPTYLALYRDDLPLITHTRGLGLEYGVTVRQTTARIAEEEVAPPPQPTAGQSPTDPTEMRSAHVREPVGSVVVVADKSVPEAATDRILGDCRAAAIDCTLLSAPFAARYLRERWLERLVSANAALIRRASLILVATADGAGAFALLGLAERGVRLPDARIILSGAVSRPGARMLEALVWETLRPGELAFVPRPTGVLPLWEMARANLLDGTPLAEEAPRWGIDALVLREPDARPAPWRTPLLRTWVRVVEAGVPLPTLTLILVLPVIATVVVVARLAIGVSTFGLFGPVIVSLAFITTGLWWGTVTFCVLVGLGVLLRAALQRLRLQAPARLGILVALVAVVMAGLTVVGALQGIGPLLHLGVFPMLIMANLIESFATAQAELGTRRAAATIASTLGLAIACWVVVDRGGLQTLVLAHPEILLVAVGVDVALGRWRGLRLLEYRRFLAAVPPDGPGPSRVGSP